MACSHYVSGSAKPVHWTGEPHAVVNLKLDFDGGITVLTGASDIGQGSSTLLAQTVAEVLGARSRAAHRRRQRQRASRRRTTARYSSRVSFMVGNAAIGAARELQRVLIDAAARKLEVAAADVELRGRDATASPAPIARSAYKDVVAAALEDAGTLRSRARGRRRRKRRAASSRARRWARAPGSRYAAQVVEVSVDEDTGMVAVERVWVAHDCGRAINPLAVEGQMQGSVWMGMGQALSEETQYHEGLPLRANLLDYRVPTIVESPPIEVFIVEAPDPQRPVRRQGGGRRLAVRLPAGADQRDRRRDRLAPRPNCRRRPTGCSKRIVARRRAERLQQLAGKAARSPRRL